MAVKRITFSADEKMIEQARKAAADQNTTLNAAFREWLVSYTTHKSTTSSSAL
jgi:hypothetical protein